MRVTILPVVGEIMASANNENYCRLHSAEIVNGRSLDQEKVGGGRMSITMIVALRPQELNVNHVQSSLLPPDSLQLISSGHLHSFYLICN